MKAFLQGIPIPAGCVALGLIGLGGLLRPYGAFLLYVFLLLACLFLLPVLAKLCLPGSLRKVCADLSSLSLLAGSTMACMLLAAQLKTELHQGWALLLWAAGLLGHLTILLLFSLLLWRKRPGFQAVRGSWLLVYVGIAAAAISAPAFSAKTLGCVLLVPAALGAVILLPLVYRADRICPDLPDGQRPLLCISAAPVSIWLSGWLRSASAVPKPLAAALAVLAFLLYLPALLRCLRCIRAPFSPAFAAFTFPFVISASALGQTLALLGQAGLFRVVQLLETLLALLLCLFTAWQYLRHFYRRG